MTMRKRRWSDNDRHFGPFTYARNSKRLGFVLDSGDEESPGCCLRLHAFRHTLIAELPPILWPHRRKVIAHSWDAATIARLGRDYYFDVHSREFGAVLVEDAVHFAFGPQTMDSRTTRSKCWLVPWMNWRVVRESIYGLRGEHVRTKAKGEPWDVFYEARQACPSASFEFDDFDGERIEARTHIKEMEWRLGTGRFKWISLFRRSRIHRSLDIKFSKETGPKKGSWKGGTIGHGIEMRPGELHEDAFRRYCQEHRMKFIGRVEGDPSHA